MLQKPHVSLVICTLDESASIAAVLDQASKGLEGLNHEIIVVDDSADDRTAAVVLECARRDPRIRLLRRTGVRGLASACIAGWDIARGDILGVMDGDGQHDATLLARMVDTLSQDGADIVVASRFRADTELGLSGFRRLLSVCGVGLSRGVVGSGCSDPLAGFFFQTRAWFEAARPSLTGIGFKILVDILACGGREPRVAELSTKLGTRIGGVSKLDLRISLELVAQLVATATRGLVPARFVMFGCVGATGLLVHMAMLMLLRSTGLSPFWLAQAVATMVAMASNFTLNNLVTFRDLRLRGLAWWSGLARFIAACASGALISETVAVAASQFQTNWLLAGALGACTAAVWNYWSASRAAWGVEAPGRDAAAGVDVTSLPLRPASR